MPMGTTAVAPAVKAEQQNPAGAAVGSQLYRSSAGVVKSQAELAHAWNGRGRPALAGKPGSGLSVVLPPLGIGCEQRIGPGHQLK